MRFKTSGLLVACDDGVSVRRTLPAIQLRLVGHRDFEGDQYVLEPGGFQSFVEVNARVRKNGTASGSIFYMEVPISGPNEPHELDCSTLGRTRWTAKPK